MYSTPRSLVCGILNRYSTIASETKHTKKPNSHNATRWIQAFHCHAPNPKGLKIAIENTKKLTLTMRTFKTSFLPLVIRPQNYNLSVKKTSHLSENKRFPKYISIGKDYTKVKNEKQKIRRIFF
jgi:hypothetical protein